MDCQSPMSTLEHQPATPPRMEKLPSISTLPLVQNDICGYDNKFFMSTMPIQYSMADYYPKQLPLSPAREDTEAQQLPFIPSPLDHQSQQPFDQQQQHQPCVDSLLPSVTMPMSHFGSPAGDQSPFYNPSVVSPPLTPAVSPTSVLFDSVHHYRRKYSVDVAPFNYIPQPQPNDDLYRRSSACTAASMEDYYQPISVPSPTQPMFPVAEPIAPPTTTSPTNGSPRVMRPSRRSSRASNTRHKHVCEYPYCGWSFKRFEHLKRHMLVHTGERPHVCQYPGCGKSFSRSDNFHAHCRTHIKKEQQRRASANKQQQQQQQQQQTVPSPSNMAATGYADVYDDRRASLEMNFAAAAQQPDFIQMPYGVPLLNQDSQQQPFFLNNTPSPQTTATEIPSSSSQEDQQKSHVCPVLACQRRFKRLEHLKRHMRIHTQERPFACSFPNCHKTFSRSDNLSQHMKTHQRHEDKRRRQQQQAAWTN